MTTKPHPSLAEYPDVMKKALNKEEKHSHIIPLSSWIAWMSPVCHHVQQIIIYKHGKGRVVWNGTSMCHAGFKAMNDPAVSPVTNEAEITFGDTLPRFLQ